MNQAASFFSAGESIDSSPYQRQLYTNIFTGKATEKVQLFFASSVLHKYRDKEDYRLIRTNSSGRISRQGSWNVDFGISGDTEEYIHLPMESVVHRLPESERDHWLDHMVTLPVSKMFIRGLIRPGCLDDGDIRSW